MSFNLDDLSSNFKSLEHFKGSDYNYFVAAVQGDAKLGLSFEPAAFTVPYKGKVTPVRGLVFRGVMLGEKGFPGLNDRKSPYKAYKADDGTKVQGTPMFRHLIPLTTETSSSAEFHAFAEKAFAKMYDWLNERVIAEGGNMVVSKEDFLIETSNVLVNIEVTVPDLFHFPGEIPDWVKAPVATKAPKPKKEESGAEDDNEDD